MNFRIIGNVESVDMLMDAYRRNINDLTPALRLIANEILETEQSIFRTEGSFQGRNKWPALSSNYEDWKEVMYPGQKILHLDGPLKASLISRGANHVERMTNDSLEIGTSDKKAYSHQFGTNRMPPRPPLTVNEKQIKRWIKITTKYLFEVN